MPVEAEVGKEPQPHQRPHRHAAGAGEAEDGEAFGPGTSPSGALFRHVASGLVYGAGYSMVFTLLNTALLGSVSPQRRGAAFGTFMFAFDAGIGLGSWALGLLMGRYGFQWGWRAGVLAMLCGLPLTMRIARRP